jgi:CRISPR/Cas system Type II protein with McrA/HNH and RuvC-like nuclease domain
MKRDDIYRLHVQKLYKQSTNKVITSKVILNRDFKYDASESDAELFNTWLSAYLNKSDTRKRFSDSFKKELFNKQKGLCAVCGEKLENDFSKIHVDHIIPWTLVGDELKDNYQYLCSTCNECKSCHTDYIFKSLINLV